MAYRAPPPAPPPRPEIVVREAPLAWWRFLYPGFLYVPLILGREPSPPRFSAGTPRPFVPVTTHEVIAVLGIALALAALFAILELRRFARIRADEAAVQRARADAFLAEMGLRVETGSHRTRVEAGEAEHARHEDRATTIEGNPRR